MSSKAKQLSKSYSGVKQKNVTIDDGVPKIIIDQKLESDLLNFIRSTKQPAANNESRASYRLTKKKISDMYDTLSDTGFNKESIEMAMNHCVPMGGDLVALLDWLCLNSKDEDLPEHFSQILKDEEQKLRPKFLKEEVDKIKPKITKTISHADNNSSVKDWILKYAETQDSNDNDDDDKASSFIYGRGYKCQLDDLNERFISLVARFFDLKDSHNNDDKTKYQMESLLNELKDLKSRPGFDQRHKRLLNLEKEMKNLAGVEEELDVGTLFIHEESSANQRTVANKKSNLPSHNDLEFRDFSYTRQQWTAKSPKQFFIDWIRKKMQSCSFSFEKEDCGGGRWRSKCLLKRPSKEGGDVTANPNILCNNIKDAEHLACTLMLYTICKDKDLHLLLPPPYRDVWVEWRKDEHEKVFVMAKECTKDRDVFIEKLFKKIINSEPLSPKDTKKSGDDVDNWEVLDGNVAMPTLPPSHKDKLISECKQIFEENKNSKQFKELFEERKSLPVFAFREKILNIFRNYEVFIVAGETGSGKSTQIPQFILEELLISSSSSPLIICTEPRRISAVSLSLRVSSEMGERRGPGAPRSLCGYQIRSEVKRNAYTRLLFCTTGVLLRRMQENLNVKDVGCIIVDEVHERDLNTDVLLIHLLELLTNQERVQRSKLKVILMSATVDCDKFSKYFFNCPIVSVSGRSHHVEVFHLENIIELTKYKLESESPYSLAYEDIMQEESTRIKVTSKKGETKDMDIVWSKQDLFKIDRTDLDPNIFSLSTRNILTRMNQEVINPDLIMEILRWLFVSGHGVKAHKETLRGREGAVLVFLPGLSAIDELREVITSDPLFGDVSRFLVLPLHSVLSSKEQSIVFSIPPPEITKIVLSTNISETGLTIPDIVYVVDCGREKQKRYMESSRISQLRQVWISRASALQRQGRAGRVRPGVCFRLYTSNKFSSMSVQTLPEMKRLPLQGLCLHIMKCYSCNVSEILSKAIDPPNTSSISTAMSILREVGACHGSNLTPLGHHLANLPLDAQLGKILIYAGILGCLEQASIMISCMTEKSPFQSRLDRNFNSESGRGQFDHFGSDQLTTYLAVRRCLSLKSRQERLAYCRKHFMKFDVIKDIEMASRELNDFILGYGFDSSILKSDPNFLRTFSPSSIDLKPPMVNLLKALLVGGLYPNVGKLVAGDKHGRKGQSEVHIGPSGEVAAIHGSSVNRGINSDGWIVYLEKEKRNKIFLIDTTIVTSNIPLLLFGGDIQVQHQQHTILVDDWIKFKAPAKIGVLVKEMKKNIDEFLNRKLHDTNLDISDDPVLPLIIRLITNDDKQ